MSHQPSLLPCDEFSGADFSADRRYRYRLWRNWRTGPRACFIMLNPSTADEIVSDPTVRRCISFAHSWGMAGIDVVNLYALISSDPSALWNDRDPIGPDNDARILSAATRAQIVVAAWGSCPRALDRATHVLEVLLNVALTCFGLTHAGDPKHPLYLAASTPLMTYARLPDRPSSTTRRHP